MARRLDLVLFSSLLVCSVAGAQSDKPVVSATVDPCVPVDHEQFQRLLAIELGTSAAGEGVSAATRIAIGCTEEGIELRLADSVTRKSMARVLPPESLQGPSSARLLALATAEFVVASWIELEVRPEPAIAPIGEDADASATDAARRAAQRRVPPRARAAELELGVGLFAQLLPESDAFLLPGAGLRAAGHPLPAVAWFASVDFALGRAGFAQGDIAVGVASAALGVAGRLALDGATLYAGAGGRFGISRIEGLPSGERAAGRSVSPPWGGPLLWTRLSWKLGAEFRLSIEVEAGLVTLPVRAKLDQDVVVALEGVWITPSLSLAVAL